MGYLEDLAEIELELKRLSDSGADVIAMQFIIDGILWIQDAARNGSDVSQEISFLKNCL